MSSGNNDCNADFAYTKNISFVYYHTLTNDEKNNGLDIKMFSKGVNSHANTKSVGFTNVQTVVELV